MTESISSIKNGWTNGQNELYSRCSVFIDQREEKSGRGQGYQPLESGDEQHSLRAGKRSYSIASSYACLNLTGR